MTDETYERIVDFVKRNAPPDPHGNLGRLAQIPVYISDEVADDEPELIEKGEYPLGIWLSPRDHTELRERAAKAKDEGQLEVGLWAP